MASNQRFGTYLTTGAVTQDKIDSFRGFLRGIRLRFGTIDINKSDNVYQFQILDSAINLAIPNKLSMIFQMWRNPLQQAPVFWSKPPYNIPIVTTNDSRPDLQKYYFYMDTNYIILCDKATNAMAAHIKTYTDTQKKVIVAWLGSFGVTGDYGDYKGYPTDSSFVIDITKWNDYAHTSAKKLIDANKTLNPWLSIALNPNNTSEDFDLDLSLGVKVLKRGELGHGYGLDGEGTFFKIQLDALEKDHEIIFFSESEGVQEDATYVSQDFFPLVVSFVSAGGKILSVAATDNIIDVSLAFLNKYAGSTEGGFSYMRDHVDYADKTRFPEDIYGTVIEPTLLVRYNGQVKRINNDTSIGQASKLEKISNALVSNINQARVVKIQAEYLTQGYLFADGNLNENDGGIDLVSGNYEQRLHMKVFEGTAIHRLYDEAGVFGRDCKAIKYGAWDYDGLDVKKIKLTYFDNNASWSLRVANGQAGATLLANVNCTGTKQWIQKEFPVTAFKKGGINSNDIVISSVRGKCELQIIEVE